MDYTNFVRTYYRIAIKKLNDFSEYNGSIVDFDNVLEIPEDKKHIVETNTMFLPNYELNINADTNYFEEFLEYYGKMLPDLDSILLNKKKIVDLYENLRVGDNDEAIVEAISLYVNVGTDYLREMGVLA